MAFVLTSSISPKFDTKIIYDDWIGRDWFIFQEGVYDLGSEILKYMQDLISERSHREGKTGNLAKSIKLYNFKGSGEVGWGIGKKSEMNQLAPYWYLLNFGGMSWAGITGKAVPGSFGGNPPNAMMAGTGVGIERFNYEPYIKGQHGKEGNYFMYVKSPIAPMNYIEASRLQLNNLIINLLNKIKNEGEINAVKGKFVTG